MSVLQLGSVGYDVRQLQNRLTELGFYKGIVDGSFGGGTDSAVRQFQINKKLTVDGIVGDTTWKALFGGGSSISPINDELLDYRCLALTGSIETDAGIPECFSGLSGDFDGQGLSFGVLQWNFGQGSLQPLLANMLKNYSSVVQSVFQGNYKSFVTLLNMTRIDQMNFIRSIQNPIKKIVNEPWRGQFKALGRTVEFQNIERQSASGIYKQAIDLSRSFGLYSERAVALMFDILVQNGSISGSVTALIKSDIKTLSPSLSINEREVKIMQFVANRRAEASNKRWVDDVRSRKLTIANGEGIIHGRKYDLANQFGITLKRVL